MHLTCWNHPRLNERNIAQFDPEYEAKRHNETCRTFNEWMNCLNLHWIAHVLTVAHALVILSSLLHRAQCSLALAISQPASLLTNASITCMVFSPILQIRRRHCSDTIFQTHSMIRDDIEMGEKYSSEKGSCLHRWYRLMASWVNKYKKSATEVA